MIGAIHVYTEIAGSQQNNLYPCYFRVAMV